MKVAPNELKRIFDLRDIQNRTAQMIGNSLALFERHKARLLAVASPDTEGTVTDKDQALLELGARWIMLQGELRTFETSVGKVQAAQRDTGVAILRRYGIDADKGEYTIHDDGEIVQLVGGVWVPVDFTGMPLAKPNGSAGGV